MAVIQSPTNAQTAEVGLIKRGVYVQKVPTDLCVSLAPAVNTGGTLTLPAGGANLFHYISAIYFQIAVAGTATTAGATVFITTSNMPGSPAFPVAVGGAAGTFQNIVQMCFDSPLKATASNTNTVFTFPVPGANSVFRASVWYYLDT